MRVDIRSRGSLIHYLLDHFIAPIHHSVGPLKNINPRTPDRGHACSQSANSVVAPVAAAAAAAVLLERAAPACSLAYAPERSCHLEAASAEPVVQPSLVTQTMGACSVPHSVPVSPLKKCLWTVACV